MAGAGQGFAVTVEIEETPNSMSKKVVQFVWDFAEKDVPSPESAPPGCVACVAPKKLEQAFPKFMQVDDTGSVRSAMRGNAVSLTMTATPVTGTSSANSNGDRNLLLDSGASQSMVFNHELLSNRRDPPAGVDQFVAADGVCLPIIGYGDINMDAFKIPGVYLVRGLTANLISVGDLAKRHKVSSCFIGNSCSLTVPGKDPIGGAHRLDNNVYLLRFLFIE